MDTPAAVIVSKCCGALIDVGRIEEGGWSPWLCSACGDIVGGRLDGGTLDVGIVRDRNAAWGGTWRWWKRYLPRRLWGRFGFVDVDLSAFEENL